MKPSEVSKADTDALVKAYRAAAEAHGEGIRGGDSLSANKAADLVAAIYTELRRRGLDHQTKLLPFLSDISASVRGWAGAHALEFAAPEGEAALDKLRSTKGLIGFSAEITLEEWRAGRLRFP